MTHTLTAWDSLKLLKKYKIPFAITQNVTHEKELLKVKIPFPWAMKVISDVITHKTEVHGVRLNIHSYEQALNVFRELKKIPQTKSVIVQEQVQGGVEIIIGGKRDAQFGSTVLIGLGGIYTETFKDFCLRISPVTLIEAEEMIRELKSYPILAGARTGKSVNFNKVKQLIVSTGNLLEKEKHIQEMDLNPVILKGRKVIPVDVRIVIEK